MKKIMFFLLLIPCVLSTTAQNVLPAKYHVDINNMEPLRYPSRLVEGYLFDVRNDTAYVSLPYMGEVYSPALDSDGLNFFSPMEFRDKKTMKDGSDVLTYYIRKNGIRFEIRINAYPNGTFYLDLRPNNADLCRYSGEWQPLKE